MKSQAIAAILSSFNDECGRLNERPWDETKNEVRTILAACHAVGKIRAEDVPMDRLDRINCEGGALSWGGRSFAEHPDRCTCQGDDTIPHRHYDQAPYRCARCGKCEAYSPAVVNVEPSNKAHAG